MIAVTYKEIKRDGTVHLPFKDYSKAEKKALKLYKQGCLNVKVVERELGEFKTAVIKLDFNNAIDEYHDVKQSLEITLQLIGFPKEYLISGQAKHYRKLKKRGWLFK